MKKSLLYTSLTVLAVLIAYIILSDAFTSGINKENPYVYDLGEFTDVDSSLIKYREVKRFNVNISVPKAIDYHKGLIGIAYWDHLQVIDTMGNEYLNQHLDDSVTSISFSPDGNIFLGCMDHIEIYSIHGELIDKWDPIDPSTYITSIAFNPTMVFVADAGGPLVHRFNYDGTHLGSFDGAGRIDSEFGFVVPSPYFDVEVDPEGQLWVANTGLLCVENYSDDGTYRAYWGEPSFSIDGFVGCCNPAQFTIFSDGSFVTSEKGISRIKVYNPWGELESVVASPAQFDPDAEPADLAVDEEDRIYVLDISKKMIRKFERKS